MLIHNRQSQSTSDISKFTINKLYNKLALLTLSYSRALVKYQRAIEPRVLKRSVIKRKDKKRVLAKVEKTCKKSRSGKHV
jgi:hypothetical protein